MKQTHLISILIIVILATSCNPRFGVTPTLAPQLMETPNPSETPTQAAPTATPRPVILFEQNFEDASPDDLSAFHNFSVRTDDGGNHILCNDDSSRYLPALFGYDNWADYAVEMRVEILDYGEDSYLNLNARLNASGQLGYYGSLNPKTYIQGLAYNNPYENMGELIIPIKISTWYKLRLETLAGQIKYYINDRLIADGRTTQRQRGRAGFMASPHLQVCVDDIRVWALTETGLAANYSGIGQIPVELVTDQADPGNAWGGHQTRIVRTQQGVFTAFITSGSGDFSREWHLMWRRGENDWLAIAQGDAGDGPVNLLASPDGTLHVIGWPKGVGTIWSGKPRLGSIEMAPSIIPGVYNGFWSYHAAGINAAGDICVFTSKGGETPGGRFMWACYQASTDKWVYHITALDYRYCYTYVFPQADGQLSLVATRDVRWNALGYTQPKDAFDYVFNAVGFWQTGDASKSLLKRTYRVEEKPEAQGTWVFLNAQQDAYLDTHGQMHILYWVVGPSTGGESLTHHLVLSPAGELLQDVQLPPEEGSEYARIFQNAEGTFYILSSSGLLYPAGKDGLTLGEPMSFDLKGYPVEYSGFGLAVPRTGTAISNTMDVVFPSDGGRKWIYFQLNLPDN